MAGFMLTEEMEEIARCICQGRQNPLDTMNDAQLVRES